MEQAGSTLSTDKGDVNGDGRPDLAIGAPTAAFNGFQSGSVYVVFNETSRNLHLANLGNQGFRIDGASSGDLTGVNSLSIGGDMNNDGKDDLIIGVTAADNNGRNNSGSVYVVFGKDDNRSINLASLGQDGYRIDGAVATGLLGTSVTAIDDLNGDGNDEIAVGAPNVDNNGRIDSGSVYVVFGKTSATPIDLSAAFFGYRVDGAVAYDLTGSSVVRTDDLNGDKLPELLIGSPGADNRGRKDAGSTFTIYGKFDGKPVDLANFGTKGQRIDGSTAGERSGEVVSSGGDIDGDGKKDFLIGAPSANNNGRKSSGSVYVIFTGTINQVSDLATLGSDGFRIDGASENAGINLRLSSSGDLNGDGRADVVIASPGKNWLYTVFGKATSQPVDLLALTTGGYKVQGTTGSSFGSAVSSSSDFNDDRRNDLVAGNGQLYVDGGVLNGAVHTIFGFGEPSVQYDHVVGQIGQPIDPRTPKDIKHTGTISFQADGLPSGLTIDRSSGVISGTPTVESNSPASITMSDLSGSISIPVPIEIAGGNENENKVQIEKPLAVPTDKQSPKITVTAKRTQIVTRSKPVIVLKVKCNEACLVQTSGSIHAFKRYRRLTLPNVTTDLTRPNAFANIKITLDQRLMRKLSSSLRVNKKSVRRVTLRISALDRAGNKSSRSIKLSLKR